MARSFRLLVLIPLVLVMASGAQSGVLAQDATPASGDCTSTSEEENLALIKTYFEAVEAGDVATMDQILNEDYSDNVADTPNEPGNADEISQFQALSVADLTVDHSFASGDWVAYSFNFVVGGTDLVTAIGISRFECGGVTESHFEFERTVASA